MPLPNFDISTIIDCFTKLNRRQILDRRTLKTKRSIQNAFIKLRSKKDIEQITVKELAELAEISKATFYLHYRDIYDLSDSFGTEIIENIVKGISDPHDVINNPARFTRTLANGFVVHRSMIEIIYSGSQSHKLADSIERSVRRLVFDLYPEYRNSISSNLKLSYRIKGAFYAFYDNLDKFGEDVLIDELCRLPDINW